jgi:hypothetical protein
LTEEEAQPAIQQSQGQNFRDVFLQSQNMAAEAAAGMKSAWRDIDAATGFGNKLRQLPAFLPDAAVLEAAEAEEHLTRVANTAKRQQQQSEHRPTSILGGFVRTGLTRLAQSVALPDEDPELYKEWKERSAPPPPGPDAVPHLYNKETPPPKPAVHPPHLYNRSDTPKQAPAPPQATAQVIPRLYNKETPKAEPKGTVKAAPELHVPENMTVESSGEAEDGWEDDDGGVDFDDEEFEKAIINNPREHHTPLAATELSTKSKSELEAENWVYDFETDIIPTRKRWINPRPGTRELRALAP